MIDERSIDGIGEEKEELVSSDLANTESETEADIIEDEDSAANEVSEPKDNSNDEGTTEIVGIRFKKNGKTYYFAPAGFVLNPDDRVIVDTARGEEYGYAAVTNREIKNKDIKEPLRSVIRMATPEDTEIHKENLRKEVEAFNTCIALIDQHKLEMKLIDVEFSFDRTKLLFYFSAEGRIDFRELVKDLASVFHVRIEMRQIGIRDEAKILGGLGICGRPYCCSTFLSDFGQVSVKMAKEQNLSLNSAKISGACGRLMCCLRYEYDTYLKEKALTPKVDSRVMTPSGAGVVTDANPLAGIVKVKLDNLPDDADQVLFVREDVVYEADYDGQALTQTALPERNRDKSGSEFVPAEIIEAAQKSVEPSVSEAPKAEPEAEKPAVSEENPKGDKHNRRDRDRNRHSDRRNNNQKQNKDEKEPKQEGSETQNEQRPEKHSDKHKDRRRPPRHHHNRPQHGEKNGEFSEEMNGSDISAEFDGEQFEKEQKAPSQKKKKPFRPYYRNGRKKKTGGKNEENS